MYEVVLTARAQEELDQQHDWWSEHRSANQANRWYAGFVAEMLTLEQNPKRRALAPENKLFPYTVYQLNYGIGRKLTHRALYTIKGNTVVILRVRHLRQAMLMEEDL
jgi:plasmid stabilization system protein ParE